MAVGFYVRKSVSIGPLRLNFSNSGVGASIGVKGLRLGVGPSGAYVHAGIGGLYYRSSLSPPRAETQPRHSGGNALAREIQAAQPSKWEEIDSGDADLMVDSNAEAVIEQLKHRNDGTYWFPAMLVTGIAICVLAASQGRFLQEKVTWTTPALMWALLFAVGSVVTIWGAIWGYRRDAVTKGGVAFLYELDDEVQAAYERVYRSLENLGTASVRCLLTSTAKVEQGKTRYHAGAGTLVKTGALHVDLNSPQRVNANVPIPNFQAGNERLCFFPERLIVLQGRGHSENIGAVTYRDLQVHVQGTIFTLDSDAAPPGTDVVGHTWQYVNNNGSPDRRFKNNRRLAQIRCERVTFKSLTGLNEAVMHSTPGVGRELSDALAQLGTLIEQKPELSIPNRGYATAANSTK